MSKIRVKGKPRKDPGSALWTAPGSDMIFVGRDYALQNEIDEAKRRTSERSCFRGCRTCGACANSKRDNFTPQVITYEDGSWKIKSPTVSFDSNAGKWIDCRSCERFRFHDCHNGWMRTTAQEAEPFTPDMIDLMERAGGKPLI